MSTFCCFLFVFRLQGPRMEEALEETLPCLYTAASTTLKKRNSKSHQLQVEVGKEMP
eukprot:10025.XXX_413054_413224_1 [CDS] Oithona nana genome sequencing.